jgi:hypothetical protein
VLTAAACGQVDEETSVERLEEMFLLLGLRFVLVTSNGALTGVVTKKDLLRFLRGVVQAPTSQGSLGTSGATWASARYKTGVDDL